MKNLTKNTLFVLFCTFLAVMSCKKKSEPSPQPLSITNFSPEKANIGDVVTITGTGFTNATQVKFGSVAATEVTFKSATEITAKVPSGTFKEKISVSSSGVTANATADFFTANYILEKEASLADSLKNIRLVYKGNQVWFGEDYPATPSTTYQTTFCPPSNCPPGAPGCLPPPCNTINVPSNVASKYATWDDAQAICPNGWKLPSKADYESLSEAAIINPQQQFSSLRSGEMKMKLNGYLNVGTSTNLLDFNSLGNYWTSNSVTTNGTYLQLRVPGGSYVQYLDASKNLRFCIRCVKDL